MSQSSDSRLAALLALVVVLSGCKGAAPPAVPPGGTEPAPVETDAQGAEEAALLLQLDAAVRELPTERYEIEHPHRDLWITIDQPTLAALLGREVDAALLTACRRAVSGEDRPVAAVASLVATWHGDSSTQPFARAFLSDTSSSVRASAALAVGVSPDPVDGGTVEELGRLLVEDERLEVRAAAAWALGLLDARTTVAQLAEAAQTRGRGGRAIAVRIAALDALGRIGGAEAIAGLSACLAPSIETRVRVAAARALGATLDPAGTPALLDALAYAPPPRVLRAIEQSLALITFGGGPSSVGMGGSTTRHALELWDGWWGEHSEGGSSSWRQMALDRLLDPMGEDPAGLDPDTDLIPILVLCLESPFAWQRRMAHECLTELTGGQTPIHPRALYSSDYPASCRATREWQLWARSEAERP